MKYVFQSNSELCHVWAQCTQDYGKGNSLTFQNTVLFSYCTEIAKIYPEYDCTLLSENNYSNTTSKQ